jgi:hypothetical protein
MSLQSRAMATIIGFVAASAHGAASGQPAVNTDAHVRGLDREAARILEIAISRSPTVARMAQALESSDLIVWVETHPLQKRTLGELRVVSAVGPVRHVRISLRTPAALVDLVSTLGHELHHATEVAGAPQVRDLASQVAFYRQAGYEGTAGGYFETDAAREVGRKVARELGIHGAASGR